MIARFLGAAAFALISGYAAAQTAPVPQAYVVDSTGQVIGLFEQQGSVLIQTSSHNVVTAPFMFKGFTDTGTPGYIYTSTNCTGEKYLQVDFAAPTGYITQMGKLLIYPDIENPVTLTFNSFSSQGCRHQSFTAVASLAKSLSLASRNYTPPFKVIVK